MNQRISMPCVDGKYREVDILNVDEVIALEKKIEAEGTSLYALMQHAGAGLAEFVQRQVVEGSCIAILAGSGNNGGDGWVAARILSDLGFTVKVISRTTPEELTAEPARTAALDAVSANNFLVVLNPDAIRMQEELKGADLIIDAILGTGFAHDEVRAPYGMWIEAANTASYAERIPLISADCPSGLNAQTGAHALQCIKAIATITMLAPKRGLIETSAQPFVGKLVLAPLIYDNR